MAVTGVVHPDRIWRNVGARPGDVLVLTKPLGTALVTTAAKRGDDAPRRGRRDREHDDAESRRGRRAARVRRARLHRRHRLRPHGPRLRDGPRQRRPARARRRDAAAPAAARALALAGTSTGGCRRNRDWLADQVDVRRTVFADLVEIAFDPQTSGGLLVALPDDAAKAPRAIDAASPRQRSSARSKTARDGPWLTAPLTERRRRQWTASATRQWPPPCGDMPMPARPAAGGGGVRLSSTLSSIFTFAAAFKSP